MKAAGLRNYRKEGFILLALVLSVTCVYAASGSDAVSGDGWYYSHLDDNGKAIYDSVVSMKDDQLSAKVTLEGDFSTLDQETITRINSAVNASYEALKCEWMEMYRTNDIMQILYSLSEGKLTLTVVFGPAGLFESFPEARAEVSGYLNSVHIDTTSRYSAVLGIHNEVCAHLAYEWGGQSDKSFSLYNAAAGDRTVVCEGYSKLFKSFCDLYGIPCLCVMAIAGTDPAWIETLSAPNHMFNYVQMEDGKWYAVDATWDDQTGYIFYDYFLAGTNTTGFSGMKLCETHFPVSGSLPELSSEKYVFNEPRKGDEFSSGGLKFKILAVSPETVSVTGYEDGIIDLVVPGSVTYFNKAYSVVSIGSGAFSKCKTLVSADLGSVTSIGSSAFAYCSNLKTVDLGDSLKTIGSYAFNKCFSLKTLEMMDSIRTMKNIGAYAFNKCSKISSVAVPSSVNMIVSNAFSTPFTDESGNPLECSADGLKGHIYIRKSGAFERQPAPEIGTQFEKENVIYKITRYLPCELEAAGYTGTLKHLNLAEVEYEGLFYKVTSVGNGSFSKCKTLASAELPDVTAIGNEAFSVCSNLKTVHMKSVKNIGQSAFSYCSRLSDIDFGDKLTIVNAKAFMKCYSINKLDFPDTLKTIRPSGFSTCTGINQVSFGDSLTMVSPTAFKGLTFVNQDGEQLETGADVLKGKKFLGSGRVLFELA